jgi:hypothetical protein
MELIPELRDLLLKMTYQLVWNARISPQGGKRFFTSENATEQ